MMSLNTRFAVTDKIWNPVKSSVKNLSKSGAKVWKRVIGAKNSWRTRRSEYIQLPKKDSVSESTTITIADSPIKQKPENRNTMTYDEFEAYLNVNTIAKKRSAHSPSSQENNILENKKELPQNSNLNSRTETKPIEDVKKPTNDSKDDKDAKNLQNKLLQEIIVVQIDKSKTRRNSPVLTPICKSNSRNSELFIGPLTKEVGYSDSTALNDITMVVPSSCGVPNELDISFPSSHGSEDSISDLISEGEEPVCEKLNESEDQFQTFDYLRTRRNEQWRIMKEMAKMLKVLRRDKYQRITKLILKTEMNLLLATERCNAFTYNITKNDYSFNSFHSETRGCLKISKIKIPFKVGFEEATNTFYVCILQSSTEVLATTCIQSKESADGRYLEFSEELILNDITENFKVLVKIFRIYLGIRRRKSFFRRRNSTFLRTHYYTNISNSNRRENICIEPGFQQCGAYEISMENIDTGRNLNLFVNSSFKNFAEISRHITNIELDVKKSGLINFGQRHPDKDVIIWNSKYAVLDGTELKIYNSKSELSAQPLVQICLKNIASDILAHSCHLKYCIQLDVVCDGLGVVCKFPYYLRTNTWSEFKVWFYKLSYVLNKLKRWHLLPYAK